MNNNAASWFVVYTKPRWEKKVAEYFNRYQIENYCPIHKVMKQWHDRKKMIYEPLFTSYVFVKVTPQDHTKIRKMPGVINFVYWLGKPAIVRNEEIETIREFIQQYDTVRLEKTQVNLQDTVRIIQGPLVNQEGKVIEVLHRTVKVQLPSIGYALVAVIDKTYIESIKIKTTDKTSKDFLIINQ